MFIGVKYFLGASHTKQNISKCLWKYFQDQTNLVSLRLPLPGNARELPQHKSNREATWSGQQLPPASLCFFPAGLGRVMLCFCGGTLLYQCAHWWFGRARSYLASDTSCPKVTCPRRWPRGSPVEMLLLLCTATALPWRSFMPSTSE